MFSTGKAHPDPVLGQGKELVSTALLHIDDLLQIVFIGKICIQMDGGTIEIHLPGRKSDSEPLSVIGIGAPLRQDIPLFRKAS